MQRAISRRVSTSQLLTSYGPSAQRNGLRASRPSGDHPVLFWFSVKRPPAWAKRAISVCGHLLPTFATSLTSSPLFPRAVTGTFAAHPASSGGACGREICKPHCVVGRMAISTSIPRVRTEFGRVEVLLTRGNLPLDEPPDVSLDQEFHGSGGPSLLRMGYGVAESRPSVRRVVKVGTDLLFCAARSSRLSDVHKRHGIHKPSFQETRFVGRPAFPKLRNARYTTS